MITAKALAKQLSVLEIPDGPCVILWRTEDPDISYALRESVCEALSAAAPHNKGYVVILPPGDDLVILGDEELDRMGLQRKP